MSRILSTGGSAQTPLPSGADTPTLGADTPSPGADTPLWVDPGVPPRPPGAVHAGRYGQEAGGRHPTGMHTCFKVCTHVKQIARHRCSHQYYFVLEYRIFD